MQLKSACRTRCSRARDSTVRSYPQSASWGARRRKVSCSRSSQFGGDQVRHDGWRPGDVEASNALLDGPITNGDALMLAQVLEPGLDDERFDITLLLCWVLVDSPAHGAIPAANRLQVPDGLHKGTRVGRIDSVFDLDADRSFVRGRDDVEVRLGPVRRRREIERGDRT